MEYLRPDGKTQVTIEYEGNLPKRVDIIVCSTQHDENVDQERIYENIFKYVIKPVVPKEMIDENTKIYVNHTGRFVIEGPHGDSGLTGRKIIVDIYGGCTHYGGDAFSGKNCTNVDRSVAYMACYIANPVSVGVNTFGTGKRNDEILAEFIYNNSI